MRGAGADQASGCSPGDEHACKAPVDQTGDGIIACRRQPEGGHRDETGADRVHHHHVGRGDQAGNDQKAAADPEEAAEGAGAEAEGDEAGGISVGIE